MKKAVTLLSGGLDSTVLLWHLMNDGYAPTALVVDYGQKHSKETIAAHAIARVAEVPVVEVDLSLMFAGLQSGSALLDAGTAVPHGHYEAETMKATVVPNRNMVLLAAATAHAVSRGCDVVAYGAHVGDHAIYADCGTGFVAAMRNAIETSSEGRVRLYAPYVNKGMRKEHIAAIGHELKAPMHLTWSCYEGGELHCGKCGTCTERKEAFALSGVPDPTEYAS